MLGSKWRSRVAAWLLVPAILAVAPPVRADDGVLAPDVTAGRVIVPLEGGGAATRHFYLYRPDGLREPAPLVIALHGGGTRSDALGLRDRFGWEPLARQHGFAVAYPVGIANHWNDGRDAPVHRKLGVSEADDVGFVARLIDAMIARGLADRRRIYVTGLSNGGMMTFRLGCELAGRLAAIAPAIAGMPEHLPANCRPDRPLPVLIVAGDEDRLVPWEGGPVARGFGDRGRVIGIEESADWWAAANGCDPARTPTVEPLPDADPADGTRLAFHRHEGCPEDAPVAVLKVTGGGHSWSGWNNAALPPLLARLLGRATRDADLSALVWHFLEAQRLPAGD